MGRKVAGISDGAVQDATGAGWAHWLAALDERGGADLTHKERVAALDDLGVESAWWQQTIANGYEQERGLREVGETLETGFQIGVQRTIHVTQEAVWAFLVSAEGVSHWLGSAEGFTPEPGVEFETEAGGRGAVRTVSEGSRVRLAWQPPDRGEPTTLQLTLSCPRNDETRTTVRIHQEKLADADEREAMRAHWQAVLADIEAALTGGA